MLNSNIINILNKHKPLTYYQTAFFNNIQNQRAGHRGIGKTRAAILFMLGTVIQQKEMNVTFDDMYTLDPDCIDSRRIKKFISEMINFIETEGFEDWFTVNESNNKICIKLNIDFIKTTHPELIF